MKININDENGSELIGIVNFDGSEAIKGNDYIEWSGEYHKNGKWSYREGGIGIKNGAFLVLQRSTHQRTDKSLKFVVIVDNKTSYSTYHSGKIKELYSRPVFKGEYKELFEKLFETYLSSLDKKIVEEKIKEWELNDSFF